MLNLRPTPILYKPASKAEAIAAQLRSDDDDWEYRVVTYESGFTGIEIYDEDGEYINTWGETI